MFHQRSSSKAIPSPVHHHNTSTRMAARSCLFFSFLSYKLRCCIRGNCNFTICEGRPCSVRCWLVQLRLLLSRPARLKDNRKQQRLSILSDVQILSTIFCVTDYRLKASLRHRLTLERHLRKEQISKCLMFTLRPVSMLQKPRDI